MDGLAAGEAEDVAAGAHGEQGACSAIVQGREDVDVVEGEGGDSGADDVGGTSIGRGCCLSVALAGHCDRGRGECLVRRRWEREALIGESCSSCVIVVVGGVERSIVPRLSGRLCGWDESTA